MTNRQSWFIAIGIAVAFVGGYAGAKLFREPDVPKPFRHLQKQVGRTIPAARFIGADARPVPDETWRTGKVMLVLLTTECDACLAEGAFLRSVVAKQKDVKFLGVLSFEQDERSLKRAQAIFPFQVVRDDRMRLVQSLNLTGVPVKIYLEDGVVKETWAGATRDAQARTAFTKWLLRT